MDDHGPSQSRRAEPWSRGAARLPSIANRLGAPGIRIRVLLAVFALPIWATPAQSQAGEPVTTRAVRATLRNLQTAQEVHYLDEMTYASSLSSLSMFSGSGSQVTVEIVYADARGWVAVGRHARAPGRSCTIVVGAAEALATDHDGRVGVAGEVVCDAAG